MGCVPNLFGVTGNVDFTERLVVRVIATALKVLDDARRPVHEKSWAPLVIFILALFQEPSLEQHFNLHGDPRYNAGTSSLAPR